MTMCMREGRGGELLWMLNMTICGVGGVLLKPLSCGGVMKEYQKRIDAIF